MSNAETSFDHKNGYASISRLSIYNKVLQIKRYVLNP